MSKVSKNNLSWLQKKEISGLSIVLPQSGPPKWGNRQITASTPLADEIQSSKKFYPFFKDCIGALDGIHILTSVPKLLWVSYQNWKGQVSYLLYLHSTWNFSTYYMDGRVVHSIATFTRMLAALTSRFLLENTILQMMDAAALMDYLYQTEQWVSIYMAFPATDTIYNSQQNYKELFNLHHKSAVVAA